MNLGRAINLGRTRPGAGAGEREAAAGRGARTGAAQGGPAGGGRAAVRASLLPGPRVRRGLIALAVIAPLLGAGYVFWLRDSALVQVRTVTVTGLGGTHADRARSALDYSARTMTTLHVDRERLAGVAAAFPAVRAIEVSADFPDGLHIHVIQHRPVAVLAAGPRRVAVAGDGTVLTGLAVGEGLPVIALAGSLPAGRVPPGRVLAAVKVADGIPARLRARVAEVRDVRGTGLVVPLVGGPRVIFGDGSRVAAKWAAAVAVLADKEAAGASYLDVRVPARPAAGGLPVQTVTPLAPAAGPTSATPSSAAPAAAGAAAQGSPPAQPDAPVQAPAPAAAPQAQAGPAPAQAAPPPQRQAVPANPPQAPVGPPTEGGGAAPSP